MLLPRRILNRAWPPAVAECSIWQYSRGVRYKVGFSFLFTFPEVESMHYRSRINMIFFSLKEIATTFE